MALNKYMHPRNLYKNPPDFIKLAEAYPEFKNIAQQDVNGKISINFKDPHALRVLTRCLLRHDFHLNVEIPEDRLVPTLPLRLNYILWIEDLMSFIGITDIKGVDIGTGACAVYPLLGAVKNKWHMIGTETDEFSAQMAEMNIRQNNLEEYIKINKTSTATFLQHLFSEENMSLDFCMCNPPFYSSVQELLESRSPARPPPKNGFTGSPQELITDGGELEFIRKLIAESKSIKDNMHIFTTMIGHKYNLRILLEDLKSENITCTSTEFCQGRITRWGLAWTFKDYDLNNIVTSKEFPGKKLNVPITYKFPPIKNKPYNLDHITKTLKVLFNKLNISYKIIDRRGYMIVMDIVAKTNTWSNQRRKRRLMKRLEETTNKKVRLSCSKEDICDHNLAQTSIVNNNIEQLHKESDIKTSQEECMSEPVSDNIPVVHALSTIMKKGEDFVLEVDFLDGTGRKEGVHQIIQYIKNNWK